MSGKKSNIGPNKREQIFKQLSDLNHKLPVTRRELMGLGLAAGYATVFGGKGFSTLLPAMAYAQEIPSNNQIPFLVFDFVGGAALPGNFLVGGPGGSTDLLPSYSLLGWDPKRDGIDQRFGLPAPANNIGKIFQGMTSVLSPAAQKNLKMSSICHFGNDDVDINYISALSEAARAQILQKSFKSKGLSTQGTKSGGRGRVLLESDVWSPKQVTSLPEFVASQAIQTLKADEAATILGMQKDLAQWELELLQKDSGMDAMTLKGQINEAIQYNLENITGGNTDPRKNAALNGLFNLNTREDSLLGVIAMNTLLGAAGPSAFTFDDYDYHNRGQQTTDSLDLVAGQRIGKAIELAHRLQRPLFFQILTDGGVGVVEGTRNWDGDKGDRSMTIIGFYHPTRAVQQKKTQLNHYVVGQGADITTLIGGGNTDKKPFVARAVAINYLSACGLLPRIRELYSEGEISSEFINEVLMLA